MVVDVVDVVEVERMRVCGHFQHRKHVGQVVGGFPVVAGG